MPSFAKGTAFLARVGDPGHWLSSAMTRELALRKRMQF